jgi:hypothetical protein
MEKRVVFAAALVILAGFLASNIDFGLTGAYYGGYVHRLEGSNLYKDTTDTPRFETGYGKLPGFNIEEHDVRLNTIYVCDNEELAALKKEYSKLAAINARYKNKANRVISMADSLFIWSRYGVDMNSPSDILKLDANEDGRFDANDVRVIANKISSCASNSQRYDKVIREKQNSRSSYLGRYCVRGKICEERTDPNMILICDEATNTWVVKEILVGKSCTGGIQNFGESVWERGYRIGQEYPNEATEKVSVFFPGT